MRDGRQETWTAVGGTASFHLSPPGVRSRQPNLYRVTIGIDGAEFVNAAGVRVRPSRQIRLVALAGGFAG
jgi:hypothetical protein